jgi:DNA-binding Lrp family transcriptional regulator
MDKMDYLILAEIHKGTKSFTDIAKKVKSSAYTVRRRYEKMRKEGIIYSSHISLDLGRLGYQGKAFLLIHIDPNSNKLEIMASLRKIEGIFGLIDVTGPCDIIALAPVRDLSAIQTLVAETKKGPHIQKVEFYCISDVSFPLGGNFDEVLSQRCHTIADAL